MPGLEIGSWVFYAGHGVAQVADKEEHEFGDTKQEFYVIELVQSGRLLLPVSNAESAEIRPLIDKDKAKVMLEIATKPPDDPDDGGRRERVARYTSELRTGDPEQYTEVYRQLLYRTARGNTSMTEQRLLDSAQAYFCDEVGTVLGRDPQKLAEDLLAKAEKLAAADS